MIKKIIVGVLVVGVVLLAGWKLFLSNGSDNNDFDGVKDNLTSYHMEATMEFDENDEKKNYFVTVDYYKDGENDKFRISLLDTNNNQEQIHFPIFLESQLYYWRFSTKHI